MGFGNGLPSTEPAAMGSWLTSDDGQCEITHVSWARWNKSGTLDSLLDFQRTYLVRTRRALKKALPRTRQTGAIIRLLTSVELDLQKMRRATDARIVVADHVFAAPSRVRVIKTQNRWNEGTQVVLDLPLVLRSRGHNFRFGD